MNISGLHLSVDEAMTSTELHDRWLQLFHLRNEAHKLAAAMWLEWKNTTEPVKANRLWKEYSAFQSDYRVLAAWTDLVHTAWVFATDGRRCRFLTKHSTADRTPVSTS